MAHRQVARFGLLHILSFALAVVLVLPPGAASGQSVRAKSLQVGTIEQRRRVLIAMLRMPSSERRAADWNAVTDELRRVEQLVHDPSNRVTSDSLLHLHYVNLITAVGQSRDPAVIPLLASNCLLACLGAIDYVRTCPTAYAGHPSGDTGPVCASTPQKTRELWRRFDARVVRPTIRQSLALPPAMHTEVVRQSQPP